ncbi:FHA domain-containing protein [Myxococcus landrumensis]|uniref:FHA domain-containing protein n=1 Tax=Myxococcus landrumensis TaxID=2813577 RepID=UPI001F507E18|nr:FHA domain-containing protein [Myxococcus landrumus]
MLKLIIEDDEGRKTVVPFVRDEITIGRQEGNTIRLTERNVSRRHARLVRLNGHVVVEDLGSYNGTRINGERIAGQSPLSEGDLIQIGDYDLALQAEGANAVGAITTKVPARRQEPEPEPNEPARSSRDEDEAGGGGGDENDHTPPSQDSADKRRNSTSIIRLDHVEADRPRKLEDIPTHDAPRLVVLSPDELRGQEFACIRTELRIGRTDDNDIALDHRSLSRTHAKLVREATGEWRVIDMQSANGMTVNGESYAQASLGSGDIVELGHVKLRFLLAGDAADEGDDSEQPSGSKMKFVLPPILALALGIGGFFIWNMVQGQGTNPQPGQNPPVATQPAQPATPPKTAVADPTPPVEQPETQPPETPPAPAKPSLDQLMAETRKALAAQDLDLADSTAAQMAAAGQLTKEAKALGEEVKAERANKAQLDAAEKALADGDLEQARGLIEAAAGSKAFAKRHGELKTRFAKLTADAEAAAQQAAAAKTPPEVKPAGGKEQPVAKTPAEVLDEQTAELVKKSQALVKAGKYRDALNVAEQCAKKDNSNPDCQLLMGITKARLNEIDEGAKHYRKFLELAPENHPYRKGVEAQLKTYDEAKTK